MAKGKQSKGTDELKPEGAPESQPEPTAPAPDIGTQPRLTQTQSAPQFRATGAAQGQGVTHFEKLASGSNESLTFKTETELAKYNEDVRAVNNMQLEDPIRFQAEHGYFPRRGDTSIEKRGLTPQDQDDVITAKKRLEGPDDKGNFKAVPI